MHSLDLVGGEGIPTVFSFMPITISMWYILLGYEIKAWNEKHGKSGSYLFGGLMIYIVSVCAIFSLSYYNEYLVLGTVTGKYYYYAFLPVVTASAGAVIAISNITIKKGSHTICRIGRTTFGIYLIHPVIYSVIWHLGIEGLIPKIGLIGFLVLFILLTFIVSFAIVLLLQGFAKKCMGKGKR